MSWTPQPTQDGSFTFFSEEFGETFHSVQGARAEAFQKFVQTTQLVQRATQPTLALLDVCYGLGYNTAAALEAIGQVNPRCRVIAHGLELDATVPQAAIAANLLQDWPPSVQGILQTLATTHTYRDRVLEAHLWLGDARQTIQTLVHQGFQADAIFLDPFSPRCCPQLWTVEFLDQVAQCLAPTGRLATYSRSAAVRSALQQAGLQLGTIPVEGAVVSHEWSQGTIAAWDAADLPALSRLEQEHLHTRAAVPYRDPHLDDSAEGIRDRHAADQRTCGLESTSSWRRRWGIQ
jgi:tRNA U34 5-methylaminomethyl-2-thiouridine-forming methyltransferase MnmC